MENNEEKIEQVAGWRSATAGAVQAESAIEEVAEIAAEETEVADGEIAEEAESAVEEVADEVAEAAEEATEVAEEAAGEAAEAAEKESAVTEEVAEATAEMSESKPKFSIKQIKPWMWAIAAVIVVAIIGYAAFSAIQSQTYDQAIKDYEAGQYEKAAEGFKGLGNYKDAADLYAKASQWVEAETAHEAAKDKGDPELWKAAAAAYGVIDDAEAAEKAKLCSGNADYYTAMAMLEKKPTDRDTVTKALELFKNCTEIADAKTQAAYCNDVLDYYKAGDLAAEGHYYDAYMTYQLVGDAAAKKLGDVEKKMDACVQSLPGNGVVWRNSDAPGDACELTIVNSGNPNAYYKLYMSDALVMTVFVAADESATFSLPSGTFSMNKAYGDKWFGTEDMFGDEGSYFICDFGGSKTFELESGNAYEISTGGSGTGIGTQSTNRNAI